MSDSSQGDGWWIASDGKWYAPELHPDYVAPVPPVPPAPAPPTPPVPPSSAPDEVTAERSPGTVIFPATPPVAGDPSPAQDTVIFRPPADPAGAGPLAQPPASVPPAQHIGTPLPEPLPAQQSSGSRRGLIIGLVALVLIAGLAFLAFRFFSGSRGTGAASPEAAVDQLVASIIETDGVGIAEILDPDELDHWVSSFTPAIEAGEQVDPETATQQEDLTEAARAVFDQLDIDITGLDGGDITTSVTMLEEDVVARVRLDGLAVNVSASEASETFVIGPPGDLIAIDATAADGFSIEFEDRPAGLEVRGEAPDLEPLDDFAPDAHLDLITVNKDGQWYVSLGYTMLENIRNVNDRDFARPDFGRAFELVESGEGGADSAEQAVRDFVEAVETVDYDTMIALTDPLSLPYLHDYQSTIDRNVDPRDQREAAAELDLRVDTLELRSEAWNERTLVVVDDLAGDIGGGTFDIDVTTWCIDAISPDGETVEGCLETVIDDLLFEAQITDVRADELIPEVAGLIAIERNGRWYLDPIGTYGFYLEQAVDVLSVLDEVAGQTAGTAGGFIAAPAPIVETTATVTPTDGVAAAAFDIDAFRTDGLGDINAALVRVESTGSAALVDDVNVPVDGQGWAVVTGLDDDNPLLPAVAVETEGDVTFTLEDAEVIRVGDDGHLGTIDDQGRPQILVFENPGAAYDFQGAAAYDGIFVYDPEAITAGEFFLTTSGDPAFGDLTVVFGEPGAVYEITRFQEPEVAVPPPPQTSPTDDFGPTLDSPRVAAFAEYAEANGFEFVWEDNGGYFDGCNGPDDPDAVTYAFENLNGDRMLMTLYPSIDRAQSAYDDLALVASPCPAFPDLSVDGVVIASDSTTFTLSTFDDPTEFFEWYTPNGDAILVATASTPIDLETAATLLARFDG